MSRSASISTAIFLVLLGLFLLTREDRVSEGMRELDLPVIAADEVEGIAIEGRGSAILRREGESWVLARPDAPEKTLAVDEDAIDRALRAISEMEARGFVSARADRHAELEIDEELGAVVTIARAGGDDVSMVVGRRAKDGGVLIRLRESDEVFSGSNALSVLAQSFDQWRRRNIVDLDANAVRSLRIEPADGAAMEFAGTGDSEDPITEDDWRLALSDATPEGFLLDGRGVATRVRSFVNLRAVGFVDEDPGSEVTGLRAGATRVSVRTAAGEPLAVRFGSAAEEEGRVYAQREGDPQIYLVMDRIVEQLADPLESLRDLSLFRFDPEAIRRFEIEQGGTRVVLERQDDADSWVLVEPAEAPLDYILGQAAVNGQLASLVRTRASRWLGSMDALDADLSDGVSFLFAGAEGEEWRVRLGRDATDAGAPELILGDPGDGYAYALSNAVVARYATPLDLFRKVEEPPMPMGGPGGQGLENLPPEIRRQIEEAMRNRGTP